MSIYEFSVKDVNEQPVSLADYKGKVLLIVNTATKCGFTPQYEGLQKLYEDYQSAGFEILDFPCDQFAHQAPGSNEEINQFCSLHYHTTFPRFAKIHVNGEDTAPLYSYLKGQKGGVIGATIKWNFTKFLIDRSGAVVQRYAPTVNPEKIAGDIEALLKQPING